MFERYIFHHMNDTKIIMLVMLVKELQLMQKDSSMSDVISKVYVQYFEVQNIETDFSGNCLHTVVFKLL